MMISAGEKTIFYTFDDGPSALTPRLLEILRENGIKASFFVTDQYGCSDMLQTIQQEGHLICLHSYSHDKNDLYQNEDAFFRDLQKLENLIRQKCGRVNKIYRFPCGSLNSAASPAFMGKLAAELESRGYTIFDWNCNNNDGQNPDMSVNEYSSAALYSIRNRNRAVFLMHHRPGDANSIESLPLVIRYCRQNGYRAALLDELSESDYVLKQRNVAK